MLRFVMLLVLTFGAVNDLAEKRTRLAEQIEKLAPAESPETNQTSSQDAARTNATSRDSVNATPSDVTPDVEEELDLLKTLDLLYVQHQATLEQQAEVEAQKRRIQGELESLRNFGPPEAKPYSFLVLEDIRDQLGAELARDKAFESDLSSAHQLLELARENFDESEHERRLAHEALEENEDGGQKATLTRELKLAELNSAIGQETVAVRRLEIELKTAKQEVCKLRQTLLEEKSEKIAKDVKFTDRDLKSRLADLSRLTQDFKRRLKDAENQLHQLDSLQARTTKEHTESQVDKAVMLAAADAFQVSRRTLHEEITLLQERLGEVDRFRRIWDRRFDVINNKADKDDLESWRDSLDEFLERLNQTEQSLSLRLDEIRVDQSTLYRQSNEATGENSELLNWVRVETEHLQRLAELCEMSILHVKAAQRSGQRFAEDLADRIEPEERRDWFGPVRESALAFWNYEIASVDDRPITIGKIIRAVAYLVFGLVIARIISRVLATRILPRFGLNEGAVHAIQSISFYAMSLLFALLSFELVNLPFAAFTFLGGAAAIGIGFGSQNILNNFISGLILLAEQPIRVGDLVEIDGVQGTVEHIGARSTRVKTVANYEILFPNSTLLEKKVTNLTLSDDLVQTAIGVSLRPSMSVDDARKSLLHAAMSHPKVLRNPSPVVLFKEFSTTAMSFELHFWLRLNNPMECRIVESEVRETLNEIFRDADAATTAVDRVNSLPPPQAKKEPETPIKPKRSMREAG